ncbi:MAG: cytochrome c3 family protein [Dehalococcoidia bacterium]
MIPGDFQPKRPTPKQLVKLGILGIFGLGAFAGVVIALTFVITAWLGRPVIFGSTEFREGPNQPIAFPHETHVKNLGMDCTFCHRNVEKEAAASVPATGLCMTCHSEVGDGLEGIEKMRDLYEDGRSIHWVRVHRVPDHVHFVHEAHIRYFSEAEGVETSQVCQKCHGEVAEMEKVRQVENLKMGDCVDCHKKNAAPTDCSTCHY